MAQSTAATSRPAPSATFNPIKWLFRLEAAYRQAAQLKMTEDCHLEDMGITRQQADDAFYGRFGQNRYYSK